MMDCRFFVLFAFLVHAARLYAMCPPDVLVMYRIVLHMEWSEETFPKHYPEYRPPAQWSVVVGRSHKSKNNLWQLGEPASDSVKLFVETGKVDELIREGARTKHGILSEFFAPPILKGIGTTETKFFVDASHSKVSIMCRMTPSPDWFIGVNSLDLCDGKKWVDSVTLDLEAIDGGTNSGYTFTSPKWTTEPRSNISYIQTKFHPASSFYYPKLDKLPRIAFVQFWKMKEFFHIFENQNVENMKLETLSLNARASVISPVSELTQFSLPSNKVKKHKKKDISSVAISEFNTTYNTSMNSNKVKKSHKSKKPRSCRISEWSEWSECSNSCGFGEQIRRRKTTHIARRGGRPCPNLEEKKWCRGSDNNCKNKTGNYFRWR